MKQTSAENHRKISLNLCGFFFSTMTPIKRSCGCVGQHSIKVISIKMGSQARETLETTCLSYVSFISGCFA